jgi:hypothetical protein
VLRSLAPKRRDIGGAHPDRGRRHRDGHRPSPMTPSRTTTRP